MSAEQIVSRSATLLHRTPATVRCSVATAPFMATDPEKNIALWEEEGAKRMIGLLGSVRVEAARRSLDHSAHFHLTDLPVDANPPASPYERDPPSRRIAVCVANTIGMVGAMKLRSFAYQDENAGRILRHVAPNRHAANEASSQGWARALGWHIDGAYRPLNNSTAGPTNLFPAPRYLFWGAIYDEPQVPITFACLSDVLQQLTHADIEVLGKPLFDVASPDSFGLPTTTRNVSVLSSDGSGGYFIRFNEDKISTTAVFAKNALDNLKNALRETPPRRELFFNRGDVIALDNWKTVHARPRFTPRWNSRDRWLVRIYATPPEMLVALGNESRCVT
ncbi:TauD/TfdA family dioxygenase [Mesorhizobium sp. 113-3-9]|uniref:TauD/TfdA family dioxygenase n=1 Tax=Mesorhizobium sp. 113-3-9 TaxID=2744517 RepID=UPI001927E8F8|nr:TauD/TfdA family dioxygenase [Mesorhizobium sp. 113-3-9]